MKNVCHKQSSTSAKIISSLNNIEKSSFSKPVHRQINKNKTTISGFFKGNDSLRKQPTFQHLFQCRHFATTPLVQSPICGTATKSLLMMCHSPDLDIVLLLLLETFLNIPCNQKHYPDLASGTSSVIRTMELFLRWGIEPCSDVNAKCREFS